MRAVLFDPCCPIFSQKQEMPKKQGKYAMRPLPYQERLEIIMSE